MTFDELRRGSMNSEQNGVLEFKTGEVVLEGVDAKNFGRKKMELRRIKSVSIGKSGDLVVFSDRKVSSRKRRSDVKKEIKLMEEALLVQLPEKGGGSRDGGGALPEHGTVSVIGRRREMEDAVAAELDFVKKGGKRYSFFGVYDGHGGWRVARACSEMLHKLVAEIVVEDGGEEIAWERVMAVGFRRMDEEVNKSGALVASTGSTAVVAVVGEEEIVVANCGDSRAVMCRGGVAVQISDDHKVTSPLNYCIKVT